MTSCSGYKLLFACSFLLLSSFAFAASAVVDCSGATPGAFTSIHDALASLPAAGRTPYRSPAPAMKTL